jgi:hypothetical protein
VSLCLATTGGIHIQTHKLMGGIYEVRRCDWVRCHDVHTEFHEPGSEIQKLIGEGDSQTAWRSHKPTWESRLKRLVLIILIRD